MSNQVPRGIRNNNPGNIRIGDNWRGLHPQQTDRSFCRFIAPEWGYRALFILLRTYERKHGLCSIRQIISRYAPSFENRTEIYIQRVAKQLNVSTEDCLTVTQQNNAHSERLKANRLLNNLYRRIAVLMNIFPILLLSSCANKPPIYKSVPSIPIPAHLLAEYKLDPLPVKLRYRDSLLLNINLLGFIEQCNIDKRSIAQIESIRQQAQNPE